nr:hypothetical protein [Tanacetum cinerariifolium]
VSPKPNGYRSRARVPQPQFSLLFCRAVSLAARHLDAENCGKLGNLFPNALQIYARRERVCHAVSVGVVFAARRRGVGPLQPLPRAAADANSVDGAGRAAGTGGVLAARGSVGHHCAKRGEQLGAAACFGLNAVSFVAVIGSLLAMKLPAYVAKPHTKSILGELKEGFQYVRNTANIRFIISMLGLTALLVLPFTNLMPVYAKDIFRGTATTFGLLDGAIGLGGLVGAFFLASLKPETSLSK